MDPLPVLVPLINPNEIEALVTTIDVNEGDRVVLDQLLLTLETAKAAVEVVAEAEGFVAGLRLQQGDRVVAGQVLFYLAPSLDWHPPEPELPSEASPTPPGLRITEPASLLAARLGVDLGRFPVGPLVTEKAVLALAGKTEPTAPASSRFDPAAIVVYGAGGHGKSLVDLLRTLAIHRIVGFIDDTQDRDTRIHGLAVLGSRDRLKDLAGEGVRLAVNGVGGISNVQSRFDVFSVLAEAGMECPALVHPTAYLEPSATVAPGVQILPHAYVGTDARVGFGVIVNTGAIISHDCQLADGANVSPGAILAGDVQVGIGALIGMGVTINLGVRVGARARIGNGATIKEDVPENGVVRAGSIWPH